MSRNLDREVASLQLFEGAANMSDMPSESTGTVTTSDAVDTGTPANENTGAETTKREFRDNAAAITGSPVRPPSAPGGDGSGS